MSASQRNKGATAERELAALLMAELGLPIVRNLNQVRNGGSDLLGLSRWAIEVKRQERLAIPQWWEQARRQARKEGKIPVLAYRQSRKPWRFVVHFSALGFEGDYLAELCIGGFCQLVKT